MNDGPFFTMLFIGAAGLGQIPLESFAAAIIPLILGIVVGNIDHRWTEIMRPVPAIVIPFFAFGLGTGIDLGAILSGGLTGIILGLLVTPFTGGCAYLAYRFLLRRGPRSGIGFVAGTTAGNSIVTPSIIAAADPRFEQYQSVATVQVATAVLISAITAPMIAAWVLKRHGALNNPEADADAVLVGEESGSAPLTVAGASPAGTGSPQASAPETVSPETVSPETGSPGTGSPIARPHDAAAHAPAHAAAHAPARQDTVGDALAVMARAGNSAEDPELRALIEQTITRYRGAAHRGAAHPVDRPLPPDGAEGRS